ncbi:MAG: hypothetical protein RI575_02920 [Balneolaceae bacterium]|nr:hypothetical protein [Balneolaceae bacterium]MDR9408684.1 hypothetical protein [Balneolaceae bacterium]
MHRPIVFIQFQGIIDELKFYQTSVDENPQKMPLKIKLSNGGREDEYIKAIRLKELFSKKLTKHQLSEAAQRLFVLLLAEVETIFDNKVKPFIEEGEDKSLINSKIQDEIVDRVNQLIGEQNICFINSSEIMGMIYYLTSKCHLKWSS